MHRFSGRFGFKAIIRIASFTLYNVTKQLNVRHCLKRSGVHKRLNYDFLFKHSRLSSPVAVVTACGCILRRVPVQAHPSIDCDKSLKNPKPISVSLALEQNDDGGPFRGSRVDHVPSLSASLPDRSR